MSYELSPQERVEILTKRVANVRRNAAGMTNMDQWRTSLASALDALRSAESDLKGLQ